ncbi:MAG: type II toxin-antitoxin system Phd/YefM family antitoxin [Blastocatellia bacterium]|nr:type II toxin-antitoxin system Phd/YefM family antitoxin [Blastocatellia bacterium]
MMTKTVDVLEAQKNLSELLSLAAAGTEIILTEDNKPLARLVPIEARNAPRIAGLHAGAIQTSDDFDNPLPEGFWAGN